MATSTEKRQKVGLFQRFFHHSMSIFPRFPTFPAFSNFYSRTPLVFLKPSSQVNNFTVFFHFFMGNVKKCVFNMLGLGWFRMKKQNSAFSEFSNVHGLSVPLGMPDLGSPYVRSQAACSEATTRSSSGCGRTRRSPRVRRGSSATGRASA